MKKIFKILLAVFSILTIGVFLFFLFTNEFENKINILGCEGIYYKRLFEKPKPGYLDFSENNAKVDVAKCLCEEYMKTKEIKYKKEILKIYDEVGLKWRKYEVPKISVDTICKHRNEIFFKMYDM